MRRSHRVNDLTPFRDGRQNAISRSATRRNSRLALKEDPLESRIDPHERPIAPLKLGSRNIMLFSQGGVVTSLERIGAGSGERYILRHHPVSDESHAEMIFDLGRPADPMSWTGFRYHNAEWSFVTRQTGPESVD